MTASKLRKFFESIGAKIIEETEETFTNSKGNIGNANRIMKIKYNNHNLYCTQHLYCNHVVYYELRNEYNFMIREKTMDCLIEKARMLLGLVPSGYENMTFNPIIPNFTTVTLIPRLNYYISAYLLAEINLVELKVKYILYVDDNRYEYSNLEKAINEYNKITGFNVSVEPIYNKMVDGNIYSDISGRDICDSFKFIESKSEHERIFEEFLNHRDTNHSEKVDKDILKCILEYIGEKHICYPLYDDLYDRMYFYMSKKRSKKLAEYLKSIYQRGTIQKYDRLYYWKDIDGVCYYSEGCWKIDENLTNE